MAPERFTSAYIFNDKELHVDTSNGDYLWFVNGELLEEGCDPEYSLNPEIVEFYKELIN